MIECKLQRGKQHELASSMRGPPQSPEPRFKIGDSVIVLTAGIHHREQGVVIQISGGSGDYVYRYRVHFDDGTFETFFGFELYTYQSE
jgi:hypothetical protein